MWSVMMTDIFILTFMDKPKKTPQHGV